MTITEIVAFVAGVLMGMGAIILTATREAEKIFNRHAHDLAGKARNWDAGAAGYTDPQMAVYAVADYLDPEVKP